MLRNKLTQLQIAAGSSGGQKAERGKITIERGLKMLALYLKVVVNINNTTGGAVTLSDTQKQALLALFNMTLNMGPQGKTELIYSVLGFDKIQREARRSNWSEIEGYTDTSTGMQRSLPNGSTTAVTFYLPIPLGRQAWLQDRFVDMWGVGAFQAKTLELQVTNPGVTIAANLVVTGTTTIDLIPFAVKSEYEVYSILPKIEQKNETDKKLVSPEGLHLALIEETNAMASCPLTNFSLWLDRPGEPSKLLYDQLSAAEVNVWLQETSILPAAGLTTDRESMLFEFTDSDRPFQKAVSGVLRVVQNNKDLATFAAKFVYFPIITEDDRDKAMQDICTREGVAIKVTGLHAVEGWSIPHELAFAMPYAIFTQQDAGFEQFPGLLYEPGKLGPTIDIPKHIGDAAKALASKHAAQGRQLSAQQVAEHLANAVPGAVQSSAGFKANPSATLQRIRQAIHA
ncbi:MAG: hypothetical protein QM723_07050 [Myxococcaceae bacterium]